MTKKQSGAARAVRQVGVIPFHRVRDGVKLCLIRRKGAETWSIPKGFIDWGDSPEEAALNEALEEAGLGGELIGDILGTYVYAKWNMRLKVAVYLMEVLEEHNSWEEMRLRDRRWYSLDEAATLLTKHPVRPLLERARSRLERSI